MKIAFITPEFPHQSTGPSGGIGTSIFNLSQGLISLGHDVLILVYGQDSDSYFEYDGVVIYKIKNVKFKGLSFYLTQKKIEKLINKLHEEKKIDIVEGPDWTGFSAFINTKCPLVIRLNGSDTYFCYLDKRKVKFKNKYLEKRTLKRADGIISVSDFTGKVTKKLFKLKTTYTVIPNSIDAKLFLPTNNDEGQNVLYFGTLIRKKGLLELPLIFNKVIESNPNAKLTIVGKDSADINSGSSSTWQLMKSLFSERAMNNTRYLGVVPYQEIRSLIKDASVCVFPTFAEALPVSWLEAMAMEKAIVASDIGWASEMISDGKEGYLVNPKDHDLYAAKINELLNKRQLREEFGSAARKKVISNFSNEVVAKESISFYSSILTT
jgi:glycosyltransferase involved in cell wall biosynthesis